MSRSAWSPVAGQAGVQFYDHDEIVGAQDGIGVVVRADEDGMVARTRPGLDAAAEEARRRLAEHLDTLDAAATRFEERLGRSSVPRIAPTG